MTTRHPSPTRPYRDVPVIHRAHWKWLVILYFFLGGIAGAAQFVAGLASLSDRQRNHRTARIARLVSFFAFLPCPLLLVLDLRKPSRFLNMLRIVKFRSPMSIGSWTLALFGGAATASALRETLGSEDRVVPPTWFRAALELGSAAAPALGVVLSGYTGTLLAATAVPVWAKGSRWIGPLFLTSATASATSLVETVLTLGGAPPSDAERVGHLEGICSVAEAAILAGWLRSVAAYDRPLLRGEAAWPFRQLTVGAGLALPLALRAASPRLPRPARTAATVLGTGLTLTGGLALRYALVVAGAESADDPEATFRFTSGSATSHPPEAKLASATRSAP